MFCSSLLIIDTLVLAPVSPWFLHLLIFIVSLLPGSYLSSFHFFLAYKRSSDCLPSRFYLITLAVAGCSSTSFSTNDFPCCVLAFFVFGYHKL